MINPKTPKAGKNQGVVSICSKVIFGRVGCGGAWGSCFALVRLDRLAILRVRSRRKAHSAKRGARRFKRFALCASRYAFFI